MNKLRFYNSLKIKIPIKLFIRNRELLFIKKHRVVVKLRKKKLSKLLNINTIDLIVYLWTYEKLFFETHTKIKFSFYDEEKS